MRVLRLITGLTFTPFGINEFLKERTNIRSLCGERKGALLKATRGRARTPKAVAKRRHVRQLDFARSAFGVRCVFASLALRERTRVDVTDVVRWLRRLDG